MKQKDKINPMPKTRRLLKIVATCGLLCLLRVLVPVSRNRTSDNSELSTLAKPWRDSFASLLSPCSPTLAALTMTQSLATHDSRGQVQASYFWVLISTLLLLPNQCQGNVCDTNWSTGASEFSYTYEITETEYAQDTPKITWDIEKVGSCDDKIVAYTEDSSVPVNYLEGQMPPWIRTRHSYIDDTNPYRAFRFQMTISPTLLPVTYVFWIEFIFTDYDPSPAYTYYYDSKFTITLTRSTSCATATIIPLFASNLSPIQMQCNGGSSQISSAPFYPMTDSASQGTSNVLFCGYHKIQSTDWPSLLFSLPAGDTVGNLQRIADGIDPNNGVVTTTTTTLQLPNNVSLVGDRTVTAIVKNVDFAQTGTE